MDKPVNVYDPVSGTWTDASKPPLEIHHFQPVVWGNKIYILGAMTGKYPKEPPLESILIYDPAADSWSRGAAIPADRRRGSCGVIVYKDKFYMVCGIQNGHYDGHTQWFDEYDPKTGRWRVLADAPRTRDHFQAVVNNGVLYVAGGRNTSKKTNQVFELTVPEVDLYDFATGTWTTLPSKQNIPTQRAGTSTVLLGDEVIVIGGESGQKQAHSNVEALSIKTLTWRTLPSLVRGRHGTGAFVYEGGIYTCAGSGNRGGGPELTSLEVYK